MAPSEAPQVTTLENGLRIVVDERPGSGFVNMGLYLMYGSMDDPHGLEGLSCMVGDMLMWGSPCYSRKDILDFCKSGNDLSVITEAEHTRFMATVFPENVENALSIFSSIIQNPLLPDESLAYEKHVAMQIIKRSRSEPKAVLSGLLKGIAFKDQPAGRIPTEDSITRITGAHVEAQLAAFYAPSAMVLSVSGDAGRKDIIAMATKTLGTLPAKPAPARTPPVFVGGDSRLAQDRSQTGIRLAFPSPGINDSDRYAATMLGQILGGSMDSRLFLEVREKRGLVYGISASNLAMQHGGMFVVAAGTGDDETAERRNIETMIPVICHELLDTTRNITPEELARARNSIRMSFAQANCSSANMCAFMGTTTLLAGQPRQRSEALRAYQAVTPEDIKRVARRIFSAKPAFAAIGPLEGLPSHEEILRLMQKEPRKKTPDSPAPSMAPRS